MYDYRVLYRGLLENCIHGHGVGYSSNTGNKNTVSSFGAKLHVGCRSL